MDIGYEFQYISWEILIQIQFLIFHIRLVV